MRQPQSLLSVHTTGTGSVYRQASFESSRQPITRAVEGLTFAAERLKTSGKVLPIQDSFYARWRVQAGLVLILHEDTESPPERLLQSIWHHQRLLRDQLKHPKATLCECFIQVFAIWRAGLISAAP